MRRPGWLPSGGNPSRTCWNPETQSPRSANLSGETHQTPTFRGGQGREVNHGADRASQMQSMTSVTAALAFGPASEKTAALISRLRRLAATPPRPPGAAQEKCDFCGALIPAEHRHFADLTQMRFLCACELCAVRQAECGEFKPLPQRQLRLEGFHLPDELWRRFQIPVEMAFFTFSSLRQRVLAFYPAPTGATESELRLDAWAELVASNPVLRQLTPDLEALLINRTALRTEREDGGAAPACYLVPIDTCYRLVGLIRTSWHGISGGQEVFETIRDFFAALKERSSCQI